VTAGLLDLVHVAPAGNSEYKEAAMLSSDYEVAEALQLHRGQ
jgi:hypothetical protein